LIGHINLKVKLTRKRNAATPHVAFEVAGNGTQDMVRPLKALLLRKRGENKLVIPKSMAPFLDPTDVAGNGTQDMVRPLKALS